MSVPNTHVCVDHQFHSNILAAQDGITSVECAEAISNQPVDQTANQSTFANGCYSEKGRKEERKGVQRQGEI